MAKSNAVGDETDTPKGAKAGAGNEADDEKAEGEANKSLTPLGQRTLKGFMDRYGEEEGEARFKRALDNGTIDRSKMRSNAVGSEKGTPAGARSK